MTNPRRPPRTTPRRGGTLHLTPWPAVVVTTPTVRAEVPPRVHPVNCPGCAFDDGGHPTAVTSEPTAAWQRGMRPVGL
ncbi:MAG TPA: hypothetical protein VGP96_14635 [Candidatus Dormibacteraeota bacterium]|nr:hypothetical protein [Candidatus Dormibacteraeota bacterium]